MKLLRYGPPGKEKPGLLDASGRIRDLSGEIADVDGSVLGADSMARLAKLDPEGLPEVEAGVRLGPCVGKVGKLVCVGLNYSDHAAETGATMTADRIHLIDKQQARRIFLCLFEHIADAARADTNEHFDEFRTRNREERYIRFTGNGTGQQCFTCAGLAFNQ